MFFKHTAVRFEDEGLGGMEPCKIRSWARHPRASRRSTSSRHVREAPATFRETRRLAASQLYAFAPDFVHQRHARVAIDFCAVGHSMNELAGFIQKSSTESLTQKPVPSS